MSESGPTVREIAGMLADRIEPLAAELLPAGRRCGAEWRVGSVYGEPGDSLGVHLTGTKRGVWADFAGGTNDRGDALDLVAAVRFRGDMRLAIAWARHWLGLDERSVWQGTRAAPRPPRADADAELPDASATRRAAQAIWLSAKPSIAGTPSEHYLAGRGIALRRMGRVPAALRHAAALWCREVQKHLPAMVAAVSDGEGAHVATHRIWLAERIDRDGVVTWHKAASREPKKLLGSPVGGAVRLWRGASGKPLAQADDGEAVAIAEGIETALSVAVACPELRVLSAVSLANMRHVELPEAIGTVILCADNDSDRGERTRVNVMQALDAAIEAHEAAGRRVRVAMPARPGDWNDVLQEA